MDVGFGNGTHGVYFGMNGSFCPPETLADRLDELFELGPRFLDHLLME